MTTEKETTKEIMITSEFLQAIETKPQDLFCDQNLVEGLITEIKKKVDEFKQEDITTEKGRKKVASNSYKIARTKTFIDDKGKEFVRELKAIPRRVDEGRKKIREALDHMRDTVKAPLDEWTEKEEKRVAKIDKAIGELRQIIISNPEGYIPLKSKEELKKEIEYLELLKPGKGDFDYQEKEDEATILYQKSKAQLFAAIQRKMKFDKEEEERLKIEKEKQAEKDKQILELKAQEEKRNREIQELKEKEEKQNQLILEAQKKAKEQQERIERQEREAREKQERIEQQERESRERQEQEARERQEKEAREQQERLKQQEYEKEQKENLDRIITLVAQETDIQGMIVSKVIKTYLKIINRKG